MFPTGNSIFSTADVGNKGKAIKASACWIWKPTQKLSNKGNSQINIDDKGYWDSGCSRHMTDNISYLSDYEPYDGGYVSFGQGGCKITGKGTIKTVTDDFSRFTWTFFLKTKDETSGSLRNLITEIENLKELRVKIIRVLVNKTQNKTPYELLNGRTPAIQFPKPFGCQVMILNTLDNLGKFEAKGDEGQDVKKYVSSLRYIVLPNWFHEAHLETSTSNAQDACNADAPESSGNSNPTATSTNPSADHMEKLAVETLIPTVSSPVPTACLNDSPEPSSNTRLISKRVTSQDDMPSLDNILTLTNRFEDILGVTTNTDDTNGVEADLGNIEDNISASHTLTLRIYKDHPKRVRPIGTKWVLKNKKDERGIVIRNKAKLVAQGYTQEEEIEYDEVFAPVIRIEAIRLFLAYASFMAFTVYQMDVKSAFLYDTIDEEVEFEALMHEKFQMSAMGELNFFLSLQVLQKEDGIFLSQEKYVGDIHKNFRYSDVRSANTLMDKENPRGKDGTGKDVDLHLYRSMIGSLMYLTPSRPDIMFAVCACARHQVTPKELAYSDSDYRGAIQDRKSTTRGCQFLGRRLISWQCKKQTIMATSITKAEYVAAASGYGQVL
uniref:Copia protein n=1 Tax=Tanacetum cinerariifolium TaxID=118510 RepID=A0A6L2NJK4_TANCI|nr:copia protein [Tanacetum cinerariifolium]